LRITPLPVRESNWHGKIARWPVQADLLSKRSFSPAVAATPHDRREEVSGVTNTMKGLHNSAPKADVALTAGSYVLRTMTVDDATDRWATWFSDPHVSYMLNSPAIVWTRDAVAKYIQQFDQKSNLLIGIFVSEPGLLVGILTVKINRPTRQGLITALVGEPDYRNKRVFSSIRIPFFDYLFDTFQLKMVLASALRRNDIIIESMIKRGWRLDQTLKNQVRSNSDGTMLDLCLFSLTRDAWRAWKEANLRRESSDDAGD
jgi:RimJ/RimL family protein N-acetyltransferase